MGENEREKERQAITSCTCIKIKRPYKYISYVVKWIVSNCKKLFLNINEVQHIHFLSIDRKNVHF